MNKIHYVYKLTNIKNNKIYIGVRTHPTPNEDKYLGSSKIISNIINLEGKNIFKKEIIKLFSSRIKAEEYESLFLTEEFCKSDNTYNIQNTGNFSGSKHGFRKDLWLDYFNEIRFKYKSGMSLKDIGIYYRCDRGTIKAICKDILRTPSESQILRFKKFKSNGGRPRNIPSNKIYDLKELLDLYLDKKWSINRISNELKLSHTFIHKRLEENNITIRPRSENNEKKFPIREDLKRVWNDQNKLVYLYRNGNSTKKLAKEYCCDSGTISKILKLNNVVVSKKKTI